ncbi:carbohydrate kinase family protein [Pseudolysinimonas sp.]|uniref:carbohydrate kinase family protein n=1 Tax=Pseudolysinimonas sp. TaxID=2680009 RepID=UPI003F7FB636
MTERAVTELGAIGQGATGPRFLVVGEALVDVIHGADDAIAHPGGSPTNVAVGLARLGHEVSELCYLGEDEYGELLRRHLRDNGVREQSGALTAPATSVADVHLSPSGDARYDFAVTWDAPTALDWTGIDVVHTGSIAIALQPGAGHVHELLENRPANVRLTVDPNVRPAFLPREFAVARIEPFLRLADVVKLSEEDAEYLYPGLSPQGVLDHLLGLGATIAAMTRGGDGAVLATVDARVTVPALADRVVDTVGAGDSFMAALISAVASSGSWDPSREELQEFARFAARASAITVSRAGPDLPTRPELSDAAPERVE